MHETGAPATARRQALVAAGAAAACVLLGVLVVWASVAGPSELFRGPGPAPGSGLSGTASDASQSPPTVTPTPEPPPPTDLAVPGWMNAIFGVLLLALAVLMLALLAWALQRAAGAWLRRRREPPDAEADFEVSSDPAAVAEQVRRRAAEEEGRLAEGEAREAIIACWQRFEALADEIGAGRRSWETPAEFSHRLLALAGAPRAAVDDLAALYREARFSEHPVGEAERERARAALRAVHAGVDRPAPVPGEGPA